MSDRESQLDEVCVLQSIYTKEEFSCDENAEQMNGNFIANINLPDGFYISYKNVQEKEIIKVPISYLPPILLKFKLPNDYPSKTMPDYEISCMWLSLKKLNLLCKRLDDLWTENYGTVILYTWTQFLKEESLEYLGIGQHIDLTRRYLAELSRFSARNRHLEQNEPLVASGKDCKTESIPTSINRTLTTTASKNEQQGQYIRYRNTPASQETKSPRTRYYNNSHRSFHRVNHERTNASPQLVKDPRIVFQSHTAIFTHEYLDAYSKEYAKLQFLKKIYLCEICFQDKLGAKCIEFRPCKHVYCKDCIKEYFETRIKDGMVQTMPCPYDKCSSEANQSQIKDVIGPKLFEKYDEILFSATLNMMDDITYCPRQSCGTPVMRDADEKMAVCVSCRHVFCVFCKMTYHGVEPCRLKAEEKRQLVEEYEQGDTEARFKLEKRYGKKQLQSMVQTYKSENWISSNSKACPRCSANIEKTEGCNKMVCWKCKEYFCWLCLTSLNPNAPYQHYMDPSSKCNNQLFHGVNLDEEDDDELFHVELDEDDEELYGNWNEDIEFIEVYDEDDPTFINEGYPPPILIQRGYLF